MWGLNAANFFLAGTVIAFIPFLNAFLKVHHWSYDEIGAATAVSALGSLIFQTPAGVISDRIRWRRSLLAISSVSLGVIFVVLPWLVNQDLAIYLALFLFGVAGTFLVPLLAALALSLAGREHLGMTIGINQSWNHLGGVGGALLSLVFVNSFGIESVFYFISACALLASLSLFLIRKNELNPDLFLEGKTTDLGRHSKKSGSVFRYLQNPSVRTLIISVGLFQIANAPLMPLLGLYLKHLGGDDGLVAWVVLIETAAMIPASWYAGKTSVAQGRKPIFAIAFLLLPLRILLCCVSANTLVLLGLQVLVGISAGIYSVAIVLVCSDLSRERGGFNSLLAMTQTAIALGGVIGPLIQGFSTQHFGFQTTFLILAGISILGAAIFLMKMPETRKTTS